MTNEKDISEMTLKELEEYENSLDKNIKIRSIESKQKVLEPKSLMPQTGERKNTFSEGDWQGKYTDWFEDYQGKQSEENQNTLKFFDYFLNSDSDTGCEDIIGDWSPADNYARQVWATAVAEADLLSICVKGLEINAGEGLGVQIKLAGAMGAPQVKNSCECATCTSITFTTYPLTIQQLSLESIVCKKDEFDVGGDLMDSYITSMKNSWKAYFDSTIYNELYTLTPAFDQVLANALQCSSPSLRSDSCCEDLGLYDLWNAVNSAVARHRMGTGLKQPYDPRVMIISPDVAKIMKRQQTPTSQFYKDVTFSSDGKLSHFCGLKVIEYAGASSCSDLTDKTVAIIIDPSRAVGCVFGEEPKLYSFFQSNCNSTRLDMWCFVAISELDPQAAIHICNP